MASSLVNLLLVMTNKYAYLCDSKLIPFIVISGNLCFDCPDKVMKNEGIKLFNNMGKVFLENKVNDIDVIFWPSMYKIMQMIINDEIILSTENCKVLYQFAIINSSYLAEAKDKLFSLVSSNMTDFQPIWAKFEENINNITHVPELQFSKSFEEITKFFKKNCIRIK